MRLNEYAVCVECDALVEVDREGGCWSCCSTSLLPLEVLAGRVRLVPVQDWKRREPLEAVGRPELLTEAAS